MADAPSSAAPEKREDPEEEGENPPSPPPPPPPSLPRKPESSPSPAVTTAADKVSSDPSPSSSFPVPAAGGAAGKSSGPKALAITVPGAQNSDPASDGARGGGECRRSFSQLLAGAMASPLGNSLAMPIVAVPVDGVRVPVVAVPCFIAPAALLESPGFTGQFAMTHQAVLATVTAQAQIQLQSGYVTSPTIHTISPVPTLQSPTSASEDNVLSPEAGQQPSSDQKLQSSQIVVKTTSGDRFNWRKYGQKQVKSSERSRSYYRCTQANCSAKKKVERGQDGRVIEIVYKGEHNHDPPQKVKCSKERKRQSIAPSGDNETLTLDGQEVNGSMPSQSKVEQDSGSDTPEQQLHCSSDCEADASVKTEEDLDEEPDLKRRLTERPLASLSPRFKAAKEPKVVVQKASDAGPSSDGYRWRKYGQKLVKGNPNPRSYYKCTQIGCPARKHVERDSVDAKVIIIQYEGKHNHDLPTPKGGSDPPATDLLIAAAAAAAAAAAITADGCIQSPGSVKKSPRTREKPDVESKMTGEKGSELGDDKALESAQALLSIGFKSTSEEDGMRDGSDANPRSLFDKNLAVSVQNS